MNRILPISALALAMASLLILFMRWLQPALFSGLAAYVTLALACVLAVVILSRRRHDQL